MNVIEAENTYVREYDNLRATSLTREMHERTCGYWFTVTSGATAHTAFRTRAELDTWLAERGLTLAPLGWAWETESGRHVSLPLQDAGKFSTVAITGSYRASMDRDAERFNAIAPLLETRVMDNGEWTPAKITEADGVRTVHYMNVNYRERTGRV